MLILNAVLLTYLANAQFVPIFAHKSVSSGLDATRKRGKKYGGPMIVDLDRDGDPDMIFCQHDDNAADLYFNKGNGVFQKAVWNQWYDIHGIFAGPISPFNKSMLFTMSIGGSRGRKPPSPISLWWILSRQSKKYQTVLA
ncbi:hypothetical protein FGB62_57g12 [Gracilaria domingensis]|nr:hypothetical protein FGB62_57g12 [Gracilaria domingensis]